MYYLTADYKWPDPYRLVLVNENGMYCNKGYDYYPSIETAIEAFQKESILLTYDNEIDVKNIYPVIWSGPTLPTKDSHPELFI